MKKTFVTLLALLLMSSVLACGNSSSTGSVAGIYDSVSDYVNNPKVAGELNEMIQQLAEQKITVQIIADVDSIEYRYTYQSQLTSSAEEVARFHDVLRDSMKDSEVDIDQNAKDLHKLIRCKTLTVIYSYYDYDGTLLYTMSNPYTK